MPRLQRNGAATVEAVLYLALLLALVVGLLDLALAGFRQHIIQAAAEKSARRAAVRGSLASDPWGPNTTGPITANADDPIAQDVASFLFGMNPANVRLTMDWPDGGNEPTQRVRLVVRTSYRTSLFSLFGAEIPLEASAVLPIVH